MERQIAFDKLAREDRFVRMRAREVAESKIGQGLAPFPELTSRESIKERAHGIMVGEMQAMEGAGRSVYDFPDAPWEFTMDMAPGVGRVPPRRDLHTPPRAPGRLYRRVSGDDHSLALRVRRGRCRASRGCESGSR